MDMRIIYSQKDLTELVRQDYFNKINHGVGYCSEDDVDVAWNLELSNTNEVVIAKSKR